ncbi:MAG: hypothetical protein PUI85_02635 [Eubacteriales bacterium]|nr:hypothetical protein [Eubacteriales bacterium]MDY3332591.1 hypothetical protein [Gallibacter sp.]
MKDNIWFKNLMIFFKDKYLYILNLFTGKKDYYIEKYQKLYGFGDYSFEVDNEIASNKKKFQLVILVMIIGFICVMLIDYMPVSSIKTSSSGNIISVERPKNDGIKVIPVEVKSISKKGTIIFDDNLKIRNNLTNKNRIYTNIKPKKSYREEVIEEIRSDVESANNSNDKNNVLLPTTLKNGEKISFGIKKEKNLIYVVVLAVLVLFIFYKNRYNEITKREREAAYSVNKVLPQFINKIILLLNTGLVFSTSFHKVVATNDITGNDVKDYFTKEIKKIDDRVQKNNAILHKELLDFAKRTQNQEFIRIAGIIADSVERGSDIVSKLEIENRNLWFQRKKSIEERGYIAQSKMIGPLVLLLLVLVIITIAPAMIEI